MPAAVKPATRIQQNPLASAERRLLTWICARLPAWTTPDQMTAIGFIGSLICSVAYVLSNWDAAWLWLVIPGFVVNWFGDSLDGSLARYRHIERPNFGYFIDHSVDSLANVILVACIGLSPFMDLSSALFALIGYLLLSIHTFISARVVDEFRLSYGAMGPTEMRFILIAMTLAMLKFGAEPTRWPGLTVFDVFALFMGSAMILMFVVHTYSSARRLRKIGK